LCPALPRCLSGRGSGVGGRVVRHGNAPPTPTVPQHRLMKAALLGGRSRVGEKIREAEKPIGRLRDRKAGCLAFLREVLTRERGDGCLVRLLRVSALCTLRSALCMLDTRRAPLEGLGGVHAGKLLAASSQAVEALLGHWISRPEAGMAHGVACLSPPFISDTGTSTSTPAASPPHYSTVRTVPLPLYHCYPPTAPPRYPAQLLRPPPPPQRSRSPSPSPSSDALAISFAGYKSRPDPDSSFPTLHDIPVAFGLLRKGMSPEPIKPASGRRTVCDHCRRRRKSILPPLAGLRPRWRCYRGLYWHMSLPSPTTDNCPLTSTFTKHRHTM
jgi:hypothetical protein